MLAVEFRVGDAVQNHVAGVPGLVEPIPLVERLAEHGDAHLMAFAVEDLAELLDELHHLGEDPPAHLLDDRQSPCLAGAPDRQFLEDQLLILGQDQAARQRLLGDFLHGTLQKCRFRRTADNGTLPLLLLNYSIPTEFVKYPKGEFNSLAQRAPY